MPAMRFRIGLIAVAFLLSALRAQACSCAVSDPGSCQVPVGDIIIRATVVSKEVDQTPPFTQPASNGGQRSLSRSPGAIPQSAPLRRVKVTLSVSERFRGAAGDTLVIRTGLGEGDCGYPFEVGHEYLVFANERQGEVTVTSCSATRPARMSIARIEQLRALRDGITLPDLYGFVGTHPLRSGETGWEQVQPMPGLTVTARSNSAEYRTQTADDGLYRFRGLPRGRYKLGVAAPPERQALWGGGAEYPGTDAGLPCAMNFEVFWDGRISGTIVSRDGQPAFGSVTAQYAGPETVPVAPVGAYVRDGRFEILRLPPGRYRLMFLPTAGNRPADPPSTTPAPRLKTQQL
jgi:Carboxypeptidase regulatory-like domain